MARQKENRRLSRGTTWIALDPGEVWCGLAALRYEPDTRILKGSTIVLNVPIRGMVRLVEEICQCLPARMIVEDFRVRPTGFNRWSAGHTLRLIGALEYATAQCEESEWKLVAPGNANRELPELADGFFDYWKWRPMREEWGHARSAWRAMLRHFLKEDIPMLNLIQTISVQETFSLLPHWLPTPLDRPDRLDVVTPSASWRVPKMLRP